MTLNLYYHERKQNNRAILGGPAPSFDGCQLLLASCVSHILHSSDGFGSYMACNGWTSDGRPMDALCRMPFKNITANITPAQPYFLILISWLRQRRHFRWSTSCSHNQEQNIFNYRLSLAWLQSPTTNLSYCLQSKRQQILGHTPITRSQGVGLLRSPHIHALFGACEQNSLDSTQHTRST